MRKIIAAFMAILIGNPVCCCAFGCGDFSEAAPDAPVHSCCSGSSENSESPGDDEKPNSCRCFLEHEKATNETTVLLPGTKVSDLEPLDLDPTEVDSIPHLPVAVQNVSKWPPDRLAILPVSRRLTFFCSYLL